MEVKFLKDYNFNISEINNVIAIAVFGSYHEKYFDKSRSDIDIMILLSKEIEFDEEFEIEDYFNSILPQYFEHDNIHYTFIHDFVYPFSEFMLISQDRVIFKEEEYLDYLLGYSVFKRDREDLEIMRNENLKELENLKNGLL